MNKNPQVQTERRLLFASSACLANKQFIAKPFYTSITDRPLMRKEISLLF